MSLAVSLDLTVGDLDDFTFDGGADGKPAPLYEKIKRLILHRILSGQWESGKKIPSENALVKELNVSRMTAHRALAELTKEGVLVRSQGVGTFVAPLKPETSLFEIRSIADDIKARGNAHTSTLLLAQEETVDSFISDKFGLIEGAPVYHSIMVHKENDLPVQLEDRYVNPKAVPDFIDQKFEDKTPTQYLRELYPAPEMHHVLEAIAADEDICQKLQIGLGEPCLKMTRITRFGLVPITFVKYFHPGSRYRLVN